MSETFLHSHHNSLILAIDLGGTNCAFGVVDEAGNILCRDKISTTGHQSFSDFIEALHSAVINLLTANCLEISRLDKIGVGAPCMNYASGIIEGAVNLPWPSPIPIVEELEKVFGIRVSGENDANTAAVGEMYFGAGKGIKNFIMITLGTGVGSAIICDGRLLHGNCGLAGELGHIPMDSQLPWEDSPRLCNCGLRGCLDAYASARGIVETTEQLLKESDLPGILRNRIELDAKTIGEAADAGDPIAEATFRVTGRLLGKACANFTAFSSPEAFIFFGGVARAYEHFKDYMIESFNENLLWIYKDKVKFFHSLLPDSDAALLGAAAVAKDVR